jgi:hypothetical protein
MITMKIRYYFAGTSKYQKILYNIIFAEKEKVPTYIT